MRKSVYEIYFLLFILELVGCSPKEKKDEEKSFVKFDSATTESVLKDASVPDDSNQISFFDPDGYYYVKDNKVKYGQYRFSEPFLNIGIVDYTNRERDSYFPIEKVFLRLDLYDTLNDKTLNINSRDFMITRDTLLIKFKDQEIGNIGVFGKFTGKNGPLNDNIKTLETIVLKAKVVFSDTTFDVDLVFWEGD